MRRLRLSACALVLAWAGSAAAFGQDAAVPTGTPPPNASSSCVTNMVDHNHTPHPSIVLQNTCGFGVNWRMCVSRTDRASPERIGGYLKAGATARHDMSMVGDVNFRFVYNYRRDGPADEPQC